MSKVSKQTPNRLSRASTPEQKEERRRAILAATAECLAESGDSFSIDALVRRLDMAKGTFFLYFPNRDSLFVALLTEELKSMLSEVEHAVLALPDDAGAAGAACAIRSVLSKYAIERRIDLLLRSLSGDVDAAVYRDFRENIHPGKSKVDTALRLRLPALPADAGHEIMTLAWSLHLGLSQVRHVRRIIRGGDAGAEGASTLFGSADSAFETGLCRR